jgi:hypothetical protein
VNTDTPTAIRLHAANRTLTLLSHTPAVTHYNHRYFAPWWKAFEIPWVSTRTGSPFGSHSRPLGRAVLFLQQQAPLITDSCC